MKKEKLICSDRLSVIWLGAELGGSEERTLRLNNGWSRGVSTNLIVRAAAVEAAGGEFGVGEAAAPIVKENFGPGEAKQCTLVYKAQQNAGDNIFFSFRLAV